MAQILKHVGKYGEKPCIVVFREVPNEPENCLIVLTGSLEPQQHDDLMSVVQSTEAQQAHEVSDVLNRRTFSDGNNMLSGLHFNKRLQKVSVSQVSLTPTPSQSVPLADVNAEIRKINGGYVPPKTDESHLRQKEPVKNVPVIDTNSDDPKALAESLLFQADLMLEDAKGLQEEAKAKKEEANRILSQYNSAQSKSA